MTKAQPYTDADLKRGAEIVQELHGLKGYEAWSEHIAKAIAAARLAAQADAPAIQPQRMRETAAEAIRTFCKSLGNNVVVVSSDDVERIYYSGISVDALSAAIAIAFSRPEQRPAEKIEGGQS